MPTNDFLPFATDSGATVLPQSDYLALPARGTGYQNGVLPAAKFNKPVRQATYIAALIGDFAAKHGLQDFLDDGNLANSLYQYELAHRNLLSFTEDTSFSIPGDYDTLQDALYDISNRSIPNTVTVVFNLGSGDHVVDSSVGSILISHPFASRVRIVGQPLLAAFPADTAVNSVSPAAVEGVLRAIWPTRIVVSGSRQGIFLSTHLGRLENILMIGDATSGQHGLLIGEWQGEMATGAAQVRNCWFHNFGADGLRANYASYIQGQNVGVSHCREYGLRVANVSGMQLSGQIVATRCTFSGLAVLDNSFFEAMPGSQAAFTYNAGNGLVAYGGGVFVSSGASALKLANNTLYGSLVSNSGYADYPVSATGGSNAAGTDAYATGCGEQFFNAGTGLTASPTRGTVGNNNAYSGG